VSSLCATGPIQPKKVRTVPIKPEVEPAQPAWRLLRASSVEGIPPPVLAGSKGLGDGDHVQVVECGLFTTSNPLKLQRVQQVIFPFGNIRAIPLKLHIRSNAAALKSCRPAHLQTPPHPL
jgi:hypothetical protein